MFDNLKLGIKEGTRSVVSYCKNNEPKLLLGLGLVYLGAGTILACRATLKANETLKEAKDVASNIRNDITSDSERNKALTNHYFKTTLSVAKTYALPVVLEGLAVACILRSNAVLTKRAAQAIIAANGFKAALDAYRERVKAAVGEEKEHEIFYDVQTVEVAETYLDKNGNEKTKVTKRKVSKLDISKTVDRRWGDSEYCPNGSAYGNLTDSEILDHIDVLKRHLNIAAQQLRYSNDGTLSLNDIYELMGYAKTEWGQSLYYVYDIKNNPNGFIDLGISDYIDHGVQGWKDAYAKFGEPILKFNTDRCGLGNYENLYLAAPSGRTPRCGMDSGAENIDAI